jgi:catalase
MSNKDKTHQSPIHGTEESQPGMDSLAPADGSHQPSPAFQPQANNLRHQEA